MPKFLMEKFGESIIWLIIYERFNTKYEIYKGTKNIFS